MRNYNLERENIALRFPKDLLTEVEKYQREEVITSRSAAIYELIRIGLKQQRENNFKTVDK